MHFSCRLKKNTLHMEIAQPQQHQWHLKALPYTFIMTLVK